MRNIANLKLAAFVLCASVGTLSPAANASVVTSIPGGTILSVPETDLSTGGPETVAPGVTWSSTNSTAAYGWDNGYGFVSNGFWSAPTVAPMEGLNADTGTMTFSFSTPVSAVGGLINWVSRDFGSPGPADMAVFDSHGNLIEDVVFYDGTNNLLTPNSFYGFSENINDISTLVLRGDAIGITDLTISTATPLPAALPLFATGLGALGLLGWRRKKKVIGK
jgi:hypothetical protein